MYKVRREDKTASNDAFSCSMSGLRQELDYERFQVFWEKTIGDLTMDAPTKVLKMNLVKCFWETGPRLITPACASCTSDVAKVSTVSFRRKRKPTL